MDDINTIPPLPPELSDPGRFGAAWYVDTQHPIEFGPHCGCQTCIDVDWMIDLGILKRFRMPDGLVVVMRVMDEDEAHELLAGECEAIWHLASDQ